VTFDPTPAATPARSQIAAIESDPEGDGGAAALAGSAADAGRDPSNPSVRGDLLNDPQRGAASGTSGGSGDDGAPWWAWSLAGVGTLALALAAFTIRQARARQEVDAEAALAELERALKRTGRNTPTGTTLAQLERRLQLSGESVGYLRSLRAGRYGRTATPPSVAQRRALRRDLAQGLGPAGRLRVLWALPPRPFTR
jgi:hypothetical protein